MNYRWFTLLLAAGQIMTSNSIADDQVARKVASIGFETAYFGYNVRSLNDEAREVLNRNVEKLKENPTAIIEVQGHCDNRGSVTVNFEVGEQRAESVKEYLISKGIQPNRIFTISMGKGMPMAAGDTEEAWAQNRRASFHVLSI